MNRHTIKDESLKEEQLDVENAVADVDIARERFESVLLDLMSKDDEVSDSDSDLSDSSKLKIAADPLNPDSRHIDSLTPLRKRRKQDENETKNGGFHHTFVMKMFDRSVDLAQFTESAPLYPVARAWMLNQPHNKELNSARKNEPTQPAPVDKNDESDANSPKNILVLPTPIRRDDKKHSWRKLQKVPVVGQDGLNQILNEPTIPPATLLSDHLQQWKQIRNEWREHSQILDERYEKSYQIFRSMFERAHES